MVRGQSGSARPSLGRPGGAAATALAALSLLAAGCWGGSPAGPPPIRIGSLIAVSGVGLVFPNQLAALRASARDVNAHGGIHGRPVQIDNCNDENDPNLAQTCARRLIADGVIATANDTSQFGMVNTPILNRAGIAEVGTAALSQEELTLPNSFPMEIGLPGYVLGGLAGMRRRGLQRLYMVVPDIESAQLMVQLAIQAARMSQVKVVGVGRIPLVATDVAPWVEDAMHASPDLVMVLMPTPQTFLFTASSQRAGARYLVGMAYGTLFPEDIRRLGGPHAITENDVEFASLPPLSATDRFPTLRTFQADMNAELAAGDRYAVADQRSSGSLNAWLSVQVIARVAAGLPHVGSAGILRALRAGPVDTLGLTPTWTPGVPGPRIFPRITNRAGYFTTQRNGVEVLESPAPFDPLQLLDTQG